ncbi:MAG TPA: hypothetical protein VF383_06990, partial [Candidatus Dormibacteraeota bacterium]
MPWSNVIVRVSPAATADTIGGAVLVREAGPGHDGEAAPLAVHATGEELGVGVGVGVDGELPPPDEPHAASNITSATIAPTLMKVSVVANGAA